MEKEIKAKERRNKGRKKAKAKGANRKILVAKEKGKKRKIKQRNPPTLEMGKENLNEMTGRMKEKKRTATRTKGKENPIKVVTIRVKATPTVKIKGSFRAKSSDRPALKKRVIDKRRIRTGSTTTSKKPRPKHLPLAIGSRKPVNDLNKIVHKVR